MNDDIFARMRLLVLTALREIVPELPEETCAKVELTPARDPAHGDMATNAALVAAKPARQPPAKLAAALVEKLSVMPEVASAEAAGPGFVNLRLHPAMLQAILPVVLRRGIGFGASTTGAGQPVNIEYVSANPTGPMHIGHCRGAVVGDVLANLLAKTGFAVTKEYYINDAGNQVTALAWAAYWRYLQMIGTDLTEEAFSAEVPGGLQYRGEYLIPVGEALAATHGGKLAAEGGRIAAPDLWIDTVRDFTIAEMMGQISNDLKLLGVEPAVFSSERVLVASGVVDTVIGQLEADGLVYRPRAAATTRYRSAPAAETL